MASSFIWKIFDVSEDDNCYCTCKLCDKKLSRGGKSGKSFGTSSLHNHAKAAHANEYEAAKTGRTNKPEGDGPTPKQRKVESMARQMSLTEAFSSKKIWDINDNRSKAIHDKILQMVILDNQPFTMIEDQGFVDLMAHLQPHYLIPSRRFFSDMIPDAYERVRSAIVADLSKASSVCFTSDIWTDPFSNGTFISLSGKLPHDFHGLQHRV